MFSLIRNKKKQETASSRGRLKFRNCSKSRIEVTQIVENIKEGSRIFNGKRQRAGRIGC